MTSDIGGGGGPQNGIGQTDAHYSVFIPSPIPSGVPAGGIFQQALHGPNGGDAAGLSSDAIAVDSSSLVPVADALQSYAVVLRSLWLTPAEASPARVPLDFAGVRPASVTGLDRSLIEMMPDEAGRERAELPDLPVVALAPPAPLVADFGAAGESSDAMRDGGSGEIPTAEARRKERRLVIRLTVYSAACLTLGASALGAIVIPRRETVSDTAEPTSDRRKDHVRSLG